MSSNSPVCPVCGERIAWPDVSFGPPFDCPKCETELSVAVSYRSMLSVLALVLSGTVAYLLGVRDLLFLFVAFAAFFPLLTGITILAKALLPPQLQLSDRASINLRDRH